MATALTNLKSAGRQIWCSRSRIPGCNFPVPCVLPGGGWFLAYGDVTGWYVFGTGKLFRGVSLYEKAEWNFVLRFLIPGMIVIDVGANQGFYSLLAAGRVGPTGKVIAFEPAPSEFAKLNRNVRLNHYSNISTEPAAVGSADGTTEFHACLDGRGSFSSRKPPAEDVRSARKKIIQAPLVSLDSYMAQHHIARLDFLKLDAEGGELEALQGASKALNTLRPVMLCELADTRTLLWGYQAAEIFRFAVSHDYGWYRATSAGLLTPAEPAESYAQDANLIALPREKTGEVLAIINKN